MEALAEFRLACDPWLPQLNECDQNKASTHVNSLFERAEGPPRPSGRSGMSDRNDACKADFSERIGTGMPLGLPGPVLCKSCCC